jgi:hypothetical protein
MTLLHPGVSVLALAAGLALAPCAAAAQSEAWDRADNIRAAAVEIAGVQKSKGADGADAAIRRCYEENVMRATAYSQAAERCVTQDMIHARVSAAFYAAISPEVRKSTGSPAPEAVMNAMSDRVVRTFARFGVPVEDARAIVKDIQDIGEPAFLEARS